MNTITRSNLTETLRVRLGLNRNDAKAIVDGFFHEIADALKNGDSVKLSSFGVFNLRQKSERPGRNPKTGEPVMIKPRTVVRFHAGNKLRNRINERQSQEYSGDFDLITQ